MPKRQLQALVVDDELTVRYTFAKFLQKLGYAATEASSGAEAIEFTSHQAFDLIVMDVRMPGMSGLEAVKQIREAGSNVPILMLSAVVDASVATTALKLGAWDYLTKPCSLDDFATHVRKLNQERNRADPGTTSDALPREIDTRKVAQDLADQQARLFQQLTGDKKRDQRK